MKFLTKRKLVAFMKNYQATKTKAREFMTQGDLNNYLKELIQTARAGENAEIILTENC